MTEFGYALSSEEHAPLDLVRNARRAEESGFDFLMISDHYHPWIDRQGHSPFVWSVIGGIAASTERIRIGTGVTCPIIRIHPAIIAQAAATSAAMLPGRFFLGLGTGENLNEHILGDKWPPSHARRAMLEEAVDIIRELWTGEEISYEGAYFSVENARLYTLPDEAPPIGIAASGPLAGELAGRIGDCFIGTSPDEDVMRAFHESGGEGKPRYGQITVSWATDRKRAEDVAVEWWPSSAVPGELSVELPTPAHFEQAIERVRPEDVTSQVICGPDLDPYVEAIRKYVEAGYDNVYLHQVGPDQAGFIEWASRELLPAVRDGSGTGEPAKAGSRTGR